VDDGWLHQANARSNVTALAKIRVLVDGTRDEARDLCDFFGIIAKDKGEAGGKGGGRLHGWKCKLANVVTVGALA
jgi:hypothetical protein